MTRRGKRLVLVAVIVVAAGVILLLQTSPPWRKEVSPPKQAAQLSPLAEAPDWSALQAYQETISRAEFERLLTTVFTTREAWRGWVEIDDHEARVKTHGGGEFHLRFAAADKEKPAPRKWRTSADLPPAPAAKPLDGLRVAIDPGHIGGHWAEIEERSFAMAGGPPVCEGDLTLLVAKKLKPLLEAQGAHVDLVRETTEPVTPLRPEALMDLARKSLAPSASPEAVRQTAERLFYRTAEIRARAQLINSTLKPDLVLCLHFNAEPWGTPAHPRLIQHSHLHVLVNGGYGADEIALEDQRLAMLEKLLSRSHGEEVAIAAAVAAELAARTGLPPYQYPPDSATAVPIAGQPYLWARNLLANRLDDCPVVFLEPYVMNDVVDHARIQAGDYDGLQEIAGAKRPSIFREYAESVATGLARHYAEARRQAAGAKPANRAE